MAQTHFDERIATRFRQLWPEVFEPPLLDAAVDVVYLVRNTITNLTTQDEQVECFRNAARHLKPGGVFVLENYVPELRRLLPGETTVTFIATDEHIGISEYDVANQIDTSRHWWAVDGELLTFG